jgi:hypothetical protein
MVIHYQSESEGVMQTIHVGGNINISFQRYQIMQKKTLNSFGASVTKSMASYLREGKPATLNSAKYRWCLTRHMGCYMNHNGLPGRQPPHHVSSLDSFLYCLFSSDVVHESWYQLDIHKIPLSKRKMKTTNKGKYYLESLQRKLVPTTEYDNVKYTGHVI